MKHLLYCIVFVASSITLHAQKFEPKDGECLVFIGQDLKATGGLEGYRDGYTDFFEAPAGITVYTNLSPGSESYGHYNSGLDGIKTKANWGAGDSWAGAYLKDSTYQNSAMAIGLSFVDHEREIAKGKHDALIEELAEWIKSTNRSVFLRIGYEFDGWDWNHYKRRHYLKAWRRIHTILKQREVGNVAFVWQSKGTGTSQKLLERWYPGDSIVDWCAYSYFGQPDQEMLVFARRHAKPVFIAEATPVRETDGLFFDSDLKKPGVDSTLWNEWFIPFFEVIEQNADVIKAFSYINSDWPSQPMWVTNPVFKQVDSRLQMSTYVSKRWKEELKDERYLNAEDVVWEAWRTGKEDK